MNFIFKRSYRGVLKAVILDWAGTIVDYGSQAPAMVFVEVFNRHGVSITIEEARMPMGMAKKDHIRTITQMPAVIKRWQDTLGRVPTEADVDAIYRQFIPLQLEALPRYATPIPGALDAITKFRARHLKIGTNTGYNREMIDILLREMQHHHFEPDSTVCASDVPMGRPAPWMSLMNAMQMGVYPLEACVKVDDTLPGIEEGLNAGMWTIGVAKTGNEIGLNEAEIAELSPVALRRRLERATRRMYQTGAHYVVDGIGDVPAVLNEINARLAQGDRP